MQTDAKILKGIMKPFDEMVAACKFTLVNATVSLIKSDEVALGQEVEVHLLPLNLTLNPAILAEIDRLGFRPATLTEVVAVIAANPDSLTKQMIVGLGSVSVDSTKTEFYPVLHANEGQRCLSVDYNDESNEWLDHQFDDEKKEMVVRTVFAAVRKQ